MSFIDEEKRAFCISEIIKALNELDTWAKFKAFIDTISKAKIKARLKQAYLKAQAQDDIAISDAQERKANDAEMESEIEGLF